MKTTSNSASKPAKKNKRFSTFVFVLIFFGLAIFLFSKFGKLAGSAFDPVSIVASVSASDLKESDGRTNILILGSDKRNVGPVTSVLTDTLVVASIGRVDGDVVLISLPRDLWIREYSSKINAIYYYTNGEKLKEVVEGVLGLPIHYYAVVNFDLFKETVNTLGGIDVNIENSFDDYQYPVEGKENAPDSERYETLHFVAGPAHMDGDTALKFVRSRHGNNNEGTDFARSRRQQKVILAIKEKALSVSTILNPTRLKELYDTYSRNVDTNADFATAQGLYLLSKQVNFSTTKTIVLDDRSASEEGGLLYAPSDTSLYGGAYVLIPRAGDFSQIHAYVQRFIFSK